MWILYDTLARIVFNLYAVQLSLTIKGGNAVTGSKCYQIKTKIQSSTIYPLKLF